MSKTIEQPVFPIFDQIEKIIRNGTGKIQDFCKFKASNVEISHFMGDFEKRGPRFLSFEAKFDGPDATQPDRYRITNYEQLENGTIVFESLLWKRGRIGMWIEHDHQISFEFEGQKLISK